MKKNKPKFYKGYAPCADFLTEEYGLIVSAIFGMVWRYSQMDNGYCQAKKETIAKTLGVKYKTVQRGLQKLSAEDIIKDHTPHLRNRPHTYTINKPVVDKKYAEYMLKHEKNWENENVPDEGEKLIKKEIREESDKGIMDGITVASDDEKKQAVKDLKKLVGSDKFSILVKEVYDENYKDTSSLDTQSNL